MVIIYFICKTQNIKIQKITNVPSNFIFNFFCATFYKDSSVYHSIWNDVYEIMCKHFRKEHSRALQDFLCVLVSQLVCARAQLRGNIVDDLFSQVLAFSSCAAECIHSTKANNKNAVNFSTLLCSSI